MTLQPTPPPPLPSTPSPQQSPQPSAPIALQTSPDPSAPPLTPAAVVPSPPIVFPLTWLFDHAAAPIKYRAAIEIAKPAEPISEQLSSLPFTHRPALALALSQHADGTWNHSMLGVPSPRAENFDGIGTISAARRLLEYGWDKDSPPLTLARRILFRLLAEDEGADYLFEFAKNTDDADMVRRARATLREAAAATLAQAGYEGDPRLRGAAKRMIERIGAFLRSPLAQKPFVRVGNQHVLPPQAAPPSVYTLQMLAFMPLFRTEHHDTVALIYHHLSQPLPKQEVVQICGKRIVAQPQLVMGDWLPNRNAADADVIQAIAWLELMARLGFLRRNDNWCKLYDRFLEDRDDEGVWHPHKGLSIPRTTNPFLWPIYPLEDHMSGDERWTDVTFRLGLIGRLSGRTIDVA